MISKWELSTDGKRLGFEATKEGRLAAESSSRALEKSCINTQISSTDFDFLSLPMRFGIRRLAVCDRCCVIFKNELIGIANNA